MEKTGTKPFELVARSLVHGVLMADHNFNIFTPKYRKMLFRTLYCMIMKNKTEFRSGCSGTLIPMYSVSFCLLSKSILYFVSFVGLNIIRNLDFKYFRAKIERENKDIRLEKIRVKAAEQRETVLQSIK